MPILVSNQTFKAAIANGGRVGEKLKSNNQVKFQTGRMQDTESSDKGFQPSDNCISYLFLAYRLAFGKLAFGVMQEANGMNGMPRLK